MGTAIKHPVPDRVKPSFGNFWHPGILTLRTDGSESHDITAYEKTDFEFKREVRNSLELEYTNW